MLLECSLAVAGAIAQYLQHGAVDAAPLLAEEDTSITQLLTLAQAAHRLHLPALYAGALTRLGTLLREDFEARLHATDAPLAEAGAVLLLHMVASGSLDDPA